ncbi:MAG: Zn binding [Planctomycetota bacterium]|nr:MAG: Zn binding [Planctomycetota bacterium]
MDQQPHKPIMKAQIPHLRALQDLDKQIFRWNKERLQKPRALDSIDKEVAARRAEHDGKLKSSKDAKLEVEKKELDLKEREERRKRLEGQRDQSKSNKEYQGYNIEIAAIRNDAGRIEDDVLKLMSSVEDATKLAGEAKSAMEAAQGKHDEAKMGVDAEIAKIDEELKGLRDRRAAAASAVDADFLKIYERIQRSKTDAVALAAAVQEADGYHCGACRMGITFQDINTVMKGKDALQCRSCSRLLYLDAKPAPAPAK